MTRSYQHEEGTVARLAIDPDDARGLLVAWETGYRWVWDAGRWRSLALVLRGRRFASDGHRFEVVIDGADVVSTRPA